jgi:hypothetical protein
VRTPASGSNVKQFRFERWRGLTPMRTSFVSQYGFTITEHDAGRPWIVLDSGHRTITLGDEESFFQWASEKWHEPRWTVQLDPWALAPPWPR